MVKLNKGKHSTTPNIQYVSPNTQYQVPSTKYPAHNTTQYITLNIKIAKAKWADTVWFFNTQLLISTFAKDVLK